MRGQEQKDLPCLAGLRELVAPGSGTAADVELTAQALRGGLMADVMHVTALRTGTRRERYVVKRISDAREMAAYGALASCGLSHLAPRLLGSPERAGSRYLVLEYVVRWKAWPWRNEEHAGMVLDLLAQLHGARIREAGSLMPACEDDLRRSAMYTLDLLRSAGRTVAEPRLVRGTALVRALADRLPCARRLLMQHPVFLHGDVHPGNVVIRAEGGRQRPVLLDWGRARLGSRFEDVASWLQCLRYFEPSAVAAHDRLLLRYIRAAGLGDRIRAEHRREYWVAAGCNALAGALGVHLAAALGATTPAARARTTTAALDWLRIARRALAYLEDGSPGTTLPGAALQTV